jgi:hypothetical protein
MYNRSHGHIKYNCVLVFLSLLLLLLLLLPSQTVEPDSPELFRTKSYDEILFDIRKISPEKIAAQMTLLDLPLFMAIQMEEFRGCGWTKKDKLRLAPNIVAFTKKFNHVSTPCFILSHHSPSYFPLSHLHRPVSGWYRGF